MGGGPRGIPQKRSRGRSTHTPSEAAPRLATRSRQASLDSGHRAVLPSDLNVACAGSGQVWPLRLVPKNDSSVLGAQGRAGAGAPRTEATSCSAGTGLTPGRWRPPFHPRPAPPSPCGEHGEGSTLQDRTSQADRSIRPGPRTHARTHTAPHTAPSCPPCTDPRRLPYTPAPALAGRPSALFSPPCWRSGRRALGPRGAGWLRRPTTSPPRPC